MFYAFKTGNLLISVGQEAVGGKAAKVYTDVSKVAGWVSGVWKNLWRRWRMVLKKCGITNMSDTTDYNSMWKITVSAALGKNVLRRNSIWMSRSFRNALTNFICLCSPFYECTWNALIMLYHNKLSLSSSKTDFTKKKIKTLSKRKTICKSNW